MIDVVYDGPDLSEVADHTGLTTAQVIDAHTSTLWRVGFSGFAPGFAYLVDGDARLRGKPRRSEPRTSVPAGSVALAGEFSAIYPRQSPGGWQLIGHSDVVLWDLERPNPALLTQGMWVQFRASGDQGGSRGTAWKSTWKFCAPGPLAVVQDLGRAGLAHLGVGRSGAADRRSHTLANRLVANPSDRATVEVTFGGFSVRVRGGDVDIAVTGADTDPAVNGVPFGTNSIRHVRDGQVISLGAPRAGLRSYLAVRGGFCVQSVLGSRSYDMMSAIGPSPLQTGDRLPVGRAHRRVPRTRPGAPVAAIAGSIWWNFR